MITYNFEINKEACFAFWAQSLVRWRHLFNKNESQYYLSSYQPVTEKEQDALHKLKQLLQRKDVGFLWLFNRSIDKEISNKKNLDLWKYIQNSLGERFELIWKEELPKLIKLQQALQSHFSNKSSDEQLSKIIKVANFFDVDIELFKKITVQMTFRYSKNSASGHAKTAFPNLIILRASNLEHKYIYNAINVLMHETAHLIEQQSLKSRIFLKNSFLKIKFKLFKKLIFNWLGFCVKRIATILKIQKFGCGLKWINKFPGWPYLFTESMITSIATGSEEINTYFRPSASQNNITSISNNFQKNKNNYTGQIKIVALKIVELTTNYLESNKKIDQYYCDELVKTWLNLL